MCVPDFTLLTSVARNVLPTSYARDDVIFNMSRLSNLIFALQKPIDPAVVYESMKDKLHQSYRAHLVPGLVDILKLHPENNRGLLGVCLSGAGPTVLALCNSNFENIGLKMVDTFNANSIVSEYFVYEFDTRGAFVQ